MACAQSISSLLVHWTNDNGFVSETTGLPIFRNTRELTERFDRWVSDAACCEPSVTIDYKSVGTTLKELYDAQQYTGM